MAKRDSKVQNWVRIDTNNIRDPKLKAAWQKYQDAKSHLETVAAGTPGIKDRAGTDEVLKFSYNFGGFSVGTISKADLEGSGSAFLKV